MSKTETQTPKRTLEQVDAEIAALSAKTARLHKTIADIRAELDQIVKDERVLERERAQILKGRDLNQESIARYLATQKMGRQAAAERKARLEAVLAKQGISPSDVVEVVREELPIDRPRRRKRQEG